MLCVGIIHFIPWNESCVMHHMVYRIYYVSQTVFRDCLCTENCIPFLIRFSVIVNINTVMSHKWLIKGIRLNTIITYRSFVCSARTTAKCHNKNWEYTQFRRCGVCRFHCGSKISKTIRSPECNTSMRYLYVNRVLIISVCVRIWPTHIRPSLTFRTPFESLNIGQKLDAGAFIVLSQFFGLVQRWHRLSLYLIKGTNSFRCLQKHKTTR